LSQADTPIDKLIPRFQEIAVPVLLVWGYDDDIIPLACGLRLHHDIPGSQWVSIKKCGHITQEEKPSETVMEISRFLSCSGK
jgi:pimeloyl-ACP methyl ester carboxylesterase